MLKIGDKLKYTKTNWLIDIPLGTVLTVTDINGIVVSAKAEYKVDNNVVGMLSCIMSYDEIEKYFEKVIETKEQNRVWTEWETIGAKICENICCDECMYEPVCLRITDGEYKTNGKRVKVRCKVNNDKYITAEATCHKIDTFDLTKGLKVACGRLAVKIAQYNLESIIKEIG